MADNIYIPKEWLTLITVLTAALHNYDRCDPENIKELVRSAQEALRVAKVPTIEDALNEFLEGQFYLFEDPNSEAEAVPLTFGMHTNDKKNGFKCYFHRTEQD